MRKRRTRVFRFHLISSLPECRSGATVRFAGHRVKTNLRGRAHIKARLFKVGKRLAVARPAGCQAAATKVRVLRRARG
ncbi:MAG: hypothetical protein H0X42_00910 [Solirubrobacterales bacterium]|nr:hypothetical protein [Solirubrobacterales bacterium]